MKKEQEQLTCARSAKVTKTRPERSSSTFMVTCLKDLFWWVAFDQDYRNNCKMQNSEKLCLQWNDFKENMNSAFRTFRSGEDFADVTLVCEIWFGHSKCHFFWSENGHFCQKCQSLRPKKWHFEWPNQNSKTTFIVQTFPKYGLYDFYFVNLSLLGAILAIF